ncbi:dienelactone hydrolase [Coprinopsis marcescibilis]|uniref:Dienelactone hydrolase n=1 Tax=Coprinopsis marcescibilis TaxID=230819 RepID=A0A5C3LCK6_COPMA|nr:dienelactone hydrolase [Coprinopsis marcescibilis]
MLITKSYQDIPTKLDANGQPVRIFIISPHLPNYPNARFPGVVVFRRVFGIAFGPLRDFRIVCSEIYQVTGPVERFAGQIASRGYIVACPSVYHEFEGPEPIPYDVEGTDRGNKYKIEKKVEAYDEDATLAIDLLVNHVNCNGRIAATGMCLGGHLAFRAAFDSRVLASACWFATDIHSATLGKGKQDDTLVRVRRGDLTGRGEVMMIFGKQDTHVPRPGRDLIRQTLEDANVVSSFLEVQAQHAFIRDEHSKGRWDAALTHALFGCMMELFERTVARDLGTCSNVAADAEHVC